MSRARSAALWSCLGAGFATLFDATTVAYTVPSLAASLDASTAALQWFLASFSLTFGLGLVPAGRLGDAFGRRRLFVAGLLVFLVGGLLSAGGPEIGAVVAGRFVQGLGAGFVSAQVLGVIQDLYHGAARIRAFVAYTAVGAVAGLTGPLVAGVILTVAPPDAAWRLILLAPLPLTAAAIVLALRGLPRTDVAAPRVTLDLPGIALLGALVVLLMLPVIEPGLHEAAVTAVYAASTLLLVALVVWERAYVRRGRLALFTPVLVRSRGFVAGNLVALLWFGALLAQGSVLTLYLLQTTGAPAIIIAAVFVPGALGRLLVSLVSRRLFARFGIGVLVAGLAVETVLATTLAVSATALATPALLVLVAAANLGLGIAGGLVEPPLRTVTLSHATPALHGVAASFLQLTQRLSATYVVALATGILLGAAGAASAGSLQAALTVCAVAVGVSTLVSLDPSLRRAAAGLRGVADAPVSGGRAGENVGMPETTAEWTLETVAWDDERASALRSAMDAEIGPRYADRFDDLSDDEAARLGAALSIDPATIVATIVATDAGGRPVGHAALRDLGDAFEGSLEVKRVFVEPGARGSGLSRALMAELERVAADSGADRLILQTGDRQPDAIALYEKIGYARIPIYPPYLEISFSHCFEKRVPA
ncbi:MFS transporter [Microbacterium sp. SS28]|uniref:MFS transporter n=1 Tax=Microbacterium sp. SS28 TaxID=2919948 RepID=UPI001FAA32DF|nr:MFS transporter [Microbacterium sp. SS28]